MTTTHLIIVSLTLLGLGSQAALVVVWRIERQRRQAGAATPPTRVGHRVTVHTKKPDDQTIFGVVAGDYADRLVLEDASYVAPTGPVPMPGRQDIETREIAWIDVHALVAPVPDHVPAPAPVEASA